MAYTKLFNSIVTSTIWTEDDKTRIVWITMLALADKNGEVQGSIPGLARIAGVHVDDCRAAITKFLSPDPDSRTKDDEGRRIEEIDGGWSLLNHQKYREMASKDESREAEAKRKARYREKIARNSKVSQDVPDMSQDVPESQHIAEADTKAHSREQRKEKEYPPNPPRGNREKSDNLPTSPQAIRISELFHRRPTTKWSAKEIKAFESIPRESLDHLDLVCRYTEAERLKGEQGRHRRDLATFLNNFTGELDRARAKPVNGKTTSAASYGI
jgi:hypothetical protein